MAGSEMPILSAVVVFGEQRTRAERCLRQLLAQTAIDQCEIVIIDLAVAPGPMAGLDHPRVRRFHLPEMDSFGGARAEGMRQARGAYIAFLEDHCYADPQWAAKVIGAFERPADLVCYAMTNANPERLLCRTFLMVEYGRWLDPAISGWIPISTNSNVAYRRSALEPYWPRITRLCEAEYMLHREMQAAGSRVYLEADAKLAHENWTRLGEGLIANALMKRLMGARRAADQNWGMGTRVAWAAGMVLTPPLHMARLARSLVGRPKLWPLFWASIPLMILTYAFCAGGEALGYLFGDGDSSQRFRDLEISIARED